MCPPNDGALLDGRPSPSPAEEIDESDFGRVIIDSDLDLPPLCPMMECADHGQDQDFNPTLSNPPNVDLDDVPECGETTATTVIMVVLTTFNQHLIDEIS